MFSGYLADAGGFFRFLQPVFQFRVFGSGALLAAGLLLSSSWLIWFSARLVGRRARSAETLLAARALEADARPWGRTLGIIGLIVAIGIVAGWMEAEVVGERGELEPFWLSSFVLVDLALLVGMAVAACALLVRQAEYMLEQGPALATLRATGTSERELRGVFIRQALIAAVPVCGVAALIPLITVAALSPPVHAWMLWPVARTLLMAGLGVLATVLVAVASRRRLRRTVTPVRLRTE
jgi:hypothetical protein